MKENGEKQLDQLAKLLHEQTLELAEQYPDDIEDVLLVLHRVTIVLVEVHEKMMLDCGLSEDDLNKNREILDVAKEKVEDEAWMKINMPGGDA